MTAPAGAARLDGFAIGTLLVLTAMWGVQQVAVKASIAGGLPPGMQAGVRSLGSALCVAGWIGLRQGRAGLADLLARPTLAPGMLIATMFAAEFLVLYQGVARTTASHAVLFLFTAPFFTALGAHLFLPGEKLRVMPFLGMVTAFGGVALAFADGLLAPGGSVVGDGLCLAAGALWGATTVVVKAVPVLARTPAAKLLWLQLAGSAPWLLAAAWIGGELLPWPQASALAWLGLFYQTVVVAFASYLVWFWLVVRYPAGKLASFTFLGPVFGTIAGAVLMGDRVSWGLVAGLVAISLGLWLVNARRG